MRPPTWSATARIQTALFQGVTFSTADDPHSSNPPLPILVNVSRRSPQPAYAWGSDTLRYVPAVQHSARNQRIACVWLGRPARERRNWPTLHVYHHHLSARTGYRCHRRIGSRPHEQLATFRSTVCSGARSNKIVIPVRLRSIGKCNQVGYNENDRTHESKHRRLQLRIADVLDHPARSAPHTPRLYVATRALRFAQPARHLDSSALTASGARCAGSSIRRAAPHTPRLGFVPASAYSPRCS